jgi:hypothetical protein
VKTAVILCFFGFALLGALLLWLFRPRIVVGSVVLVTPDDERPFWAEVEAMHGRRAFVRELGIVDGYRFINVALEECRLRRQGEFI